MLDPLWQATSPLHRPEYIDAPALRICEIGGVQIVSLATRKGCWAALQQAAAQNWGVNLPTAPRVVAGQDYRFIWAGPERWMVTSNAAVALEPSLRAVAGEYASITGQSDSRAVWQISGPKARECLAKLLPIDLHPRAFAPGDTAMTIAAHINLQIWKTDETPSFEISVFRSFADHFHHALCQAAAGIIAQDEVLCHD